MVGTVTTNELIELARLAKEAGIASLKMGDVEIVFTKTVKLIDEAPPDTMLVEVARQKNAKVNADGLTDEQQAVYYASSARRI